MTARVRAYMVNASIGRPCINTLNKQVSIIVHNTGCPKSHCTKVRAYCSACDHLICKISSGMFQKSSSFEEFIGFDIDFAKTIEFLE